MDPFLRFAAVFFNEAIDANEEPSSDGAAYVFAAVWVKRAVWILLLFALIAHMVRISRRSA